MKFLRIFSRNHVDLIELEHLRAENARLRVENAEALELIVQKSARTRKLEEQLKRGAARFKRDTQGRFA